MAKTLDTLVTETLGAQLRMILELQARVEALTAENDALKPTKPVLVDAPERAS